MNSRLCKTCTLLGVCACRSACTTYRVLLTRQDPSRHIYKFDPTVKRASAQQTPQRTLAPASRVAPLVDSLRLTMLARLRHAASTALPRLLHEQGGALAALQQRAASSHSENTNTFLREVSTMSMNTVTAAPSLQPAQSQSCLHRRPCNIRSHARSLLALRLFGVQSAPQVQAAAPRQTPAEVAALRGAARPDA